MCTTLLAGKDRAVRRNCLHCERICGWCAMLNACLSHSEQLRWLHVAVSGMLCQKQ
jgi:hypothetical protein